MRQRGGGKKYGVISKDWAHTKKIDKKSSHRCDRAKIRLVLIKICRYLNVVTLEVLR